MQYWRRTAGNVRRTPTRQRAPRNHRQFQSDGEFSPAALACSAIVVNSSARSAKACRNVAVSPRNLPKDINTLTRHPLLEFCALSAAQAPARQSGRPLPAGDVSAAQIGSTMPLRALARLAGRRLAAGGVRSAFVPPASAELLVVQASKRVREMIQPVGGALHLVEVMTMVARGRFFFGSLAHDAQFFAAQFHDPCECLFQVHGPS